MNDDDQLRDAVRGLAGGPDAASVAAELERLRPRLRAARNRRRATVAALSSVAVVVLGVGVAVLDGPTDRTVDVVDGPRVPTTTTLLPAPPEPAPPTSAPPAPPTEPPAPATTAVPGPPAAPAGPPSGGVAPTGPVRSGSGGGTSGGALPTPDGAGPPATAPPTTTAPVAQVRTVAAPGGTITVSWTPTSVRLVSVAVAPGWVEEGRSVEDTQVSVRFRREGGSSGEGSGSSQAEAEVEDGTLRVRSE
ncbi:MAG: hypothetical protein ACOYOP_16385 [Microthrixaceae bacterium]